MAIKVAEIMLKEARAYTKSLKDKNTSEVCACEWFIHPDDKELPIARQRKLRGPDTNELCRIHAAVGLIMGFLDWIETAEYEVMDVSDFNADHEPDAVEINSGPEEWNG